MACIHLAHGALGKIAPRAGHCTVPPCALARLCNGYGRQAAEPPTPTDAPKDQDVSTRSSSKAWARLLAKQARATQGGVIGRTGNPHAHPAAAAGKRGGIQDHRGAEGYTYAYHSLLDENCRSSYSVHMNDLRFEWDSAKERLNRRRHGVSFAEAQSVFYDEHAIRYYDPDHSDSEDRFIMLGMSFLLRALVVCHCCRASDSVIRIISSRRANALEKRAYTAKGGNL